MDLPVWQALYDELKDLGFVPIAVALDTGGVEAAGPWIEKANPTYPCLIDRHHEVARLYDMVNVPTGVWIDEAGTIVRGPEIAAATDSWRRVDPVTRQLPDEARAYSRRVREVYLDALRDWARRGASSVHVRPPAERAERIAGPDAAGATAAALFRLGTLLQERGHAEAAQRWFGEARRLRPDSWAYTRQAFELEQPGKAAGPEFMAAVRALGERHYYPPIEMEGMPAP